MANQLVRPYLGMPIMGMLHEGNEVIPETRYGAGVITEVHTLDTVSVRLFHPKGSEWDKNLEAVQFIATHHSLKPKHEGQVVPLSCAAGARI